VTGRGLYVPRARPRTLPGPGRAPDVVVRRQEYSVTQQIRKVGVVGCGTMGSGICEIVARHGMDVAFVEVDDAAVARGQGRIEGSLERQVSRGRLDEGERDDILGRIEGSTDYGTLGDCDLVVEAVPEQMPLKQAAFERISRRSVTTRSSRPTPRRCR
jgi:3-hydroxyacyl-CoA dehydrogenase